MAILNEPETRQIVFGNSAPVLPQAPAGKTYELWIIPKSGSPKPSGLFQFDVHGDAMYVFAGPVNMSRLGAVAVTLEPETGSAALKTTPVIAAPFSD